jgi:hypothetical protein
LGFRRREPKRRPNATLRARVIPSLERESMAGNGGFFAGHCP